MNEAVVYNRLWSDAPPESKPASKNLQYEQMLMRAGVGTIFNAKATGSAEAYPSDLERATPFFNGTFGNNHHDRDREDYRRETLKRQRGH